MQNCITTWCNFVVFYICGMVCGCAYILYNSLLPNSWTHLSIQPILISYLSRKKITSPYIYLYTSQLIRNLTVTILKTILQKTAWINKSLLKLQMCESTKLCTQSKWIIWILNYTASWLLYLYTVTHNSTFYSMYWKVLTVVVNAYKRHLIGMNNWQVRDWWISCTCV